MVKLLKPGRIVLVLHGRFAGKKGVVVRVNDAPTKERRFSHVLVAGIERPPRKVTKRMSQERINRRVHVKPFLKVFNFSHVMPTRYQLGAEIDLKAIIDAREEGKKEEDMRKEHKEKLSDVFHEKFLAAAKDQSMKSAKDLTFLRRKLRF